MSRIRLAPNDALALFALALLTVGAGLAWLPLAFIVPGALLLLYVVLPDQRPPA